MSLTDRLFGNFGSDMAIDLGTANTLVSVKGEGIVFHGHVHGLAGNRDFLRLHTDHVEGKRLSGPGADGELTVGAGGDTESSAFYSNGNARHRLTFRIGDCTGNLPALCIGNPAKGHQKARQEKLDFFHKLIH